jgi:hypothetical protein
MGSLRALAGEKTELYPPASAEIRDWLSRQYAAFDLSEYLQILAESNGIGELFVEGAERFVHNMLLMPAEEALEISQTEFGGSVLVVGNAGVDGIRYVLQPGTQAVYAFYPIDEEYKYIASSVGEFLRMYTAKKVHL